MDDQWVSAHKDVDSAVWRYLSNFVKIVFVVLFTSVGVLSCSVIGSLAYPVGGEGAIAGAVIGFLLCGGFSMCFTGTAIWLVPDAIIHYSLLLFPTLQAAVHREHGDFTAIITVHESQDLKVKGLMPWNTADLYVEIYCGSNPVKATCVRKDGKFNEQFRLRVSMLDKFIVLTIKDQDIFGSSEIGHVIVDIEQHILSEGFPWRRPFVILPSQYDKIIYPRNEKYKGKAVEPSLVLSFDHTDDFHPSSPVRHALYEKQRAVQRDGVDQAWVEAIGAKMLAEDKLKITDNQVDNYGTFSFLSKLEFKTNFEVSKQQMIAQRSQVDRSSYKYGLKAADPPHS